MRAAREERDPRYEEQPPPEPVGESASEQQEPAEDQRVGVQYPQEVLLREAEVALDGRQRDVHHRRIQHDHEPRDRDERQNGVRVDT
jgi:hypothetical protein